MENVGGGSRRFFAPPLSPSFLEETRAMKIAIATAGPTLDDLIDSHFGRADCFLIVDLETMATETVENIYREEASGVGMRVVSMLADRDVKVVLAGECGPKALRTLQEAGIEVLVGLEGPARDALKEYQQEGLVGLA